jgi:hypothetical protein
LLRQLLREMIDRIEMRWTHREVNGLTRCNLSEGAVWLRSSEELSQLSPWASLSRC